MRSIFLLKGLAQYLGTGAPRVTYEQVREACLHYGAFDNTNFSKYFKTMASEVSGSKESGYSLTARGLSSASELVTELTGTVRLPGGSGSAVHVGLSGRDTVAS